MNKNITDINAAKKWANIQPDLQQKIINNVFCSRCGVTTIVDYTFHDHKLGILQKGKCKKCGKDVARLIEDE